MTELIGKIIGGTLGVIIMVICLSLLLALPTKWTWNATMPYLFSLPMITWGKAWCLNFLCGCLIKSSAVSTK